MGKIKIRNILAMVGFILLPYALWGFVGFLKGERTLEDIVSLVLFPLSLALIWFYINKNDET